MGLLSWLRGGSDHASSTTGAGGITELDVTLSPARRHQIENTQTNDVLREDTGEGKTYDRDDRPDLDAGTARITVRRPAEKPRDGE